MRNLLCSLCVLRYSFKVYCNDVVTTEKDDIKFGGDLVITPSGI